ncbi:MAG: isochorismatase family protein [Chloroflexi bacterium]|nr:isochorismatase family protein [Chloroflexota bacterium]
MRWWEEVFSGEDRPVCQGVGGARPQPRGRHPALLVVDVTRAFCGEKGLRMAESVKEWPTSCGPAAWEAMPHIQKLLDAARGAGATVVYTTVLPGADRLYGGTVKGEGNRDPKESLMAKPGAQDIPSEIAPRQGELVLMKPKASAFFCTPLLAHLHRKKVDCLIVCGTTTSGCVRATVVDGFSWGYPVLLAEEAVFDRVRLSQAVGLFEMNAKYADVLPVAEVTRWLEELGAHGGT